ncbi:hypothetical protein DI396_09940 [Litorivita pollutaquae]|uniref:Uncharacterized protein n=1 Tax=Litorivita pollutaquae TaxID=2200892 RepID=A0A2V4MKW9_9RHOB|nr:hypothetical protein DI396_09940 [Litorivita pollutaquae]
MKELSVEDKLAGIARQRAVMIKVFFSSFSCHSQSIFRNIRSRFPLALFFEKKLRLVFIVSRNSGY